ncbi:MAG: acyl-CoA thioesterase [Leptospiraceae bacterium]|nr:acyl-CoA thioesterase [Leptospiraceae bacterium]
MKTFTVNKLIRFQHCDPAGVVFTPQYFNLFTEVIEDWFSSALLYDFNRMVLKDKNGIPVMQILAKFHNPSYLGEELEFQLTILRLREKSVSIKIIAQNSIEKKCSAKFLIGFASLKTQSRISWDSILKEKMFEYLN